MFSHYTNARLHRLPVTYKLSATQNTSETLCQPKYFVCTQTGSLFSATGERKGPMGPMSRGYKAHKLCFHTKCAKDLYVVFVGRTPDPRVVRVDGEVIGWSGTGGGLSRWRVRADTLIPLIYFRKEIVSNIYLVTVLWH